MTLETFFDKFDQFADAPDAVAKMRELVRNFAVTGKLVAQDPDDESAEALVARIAAALPDKKSENPFLGEIEALITDESEYELPSGWAWLPLGHVGIWAAGCGFPMQYQGQTDEEFLFCKVSDMNLPGNEVAIHTTVHSIDADVMKKIRARASPVGTVIFPKIGGAIATHKRRLVIRPTIIDNNCSGIQPIGLTDDRWLLLFMRSLDLTKYQSGTSVPAVSQGSLDPIRIGIPPLAEQKRIVAKVDELMALCDRLEAQQQERTERKAALARAALARFADAPTPANLEMLFYPPPCLRASVRKTKAVSHRGTEAQSPAAYLVSPADLRKSILTLAVQGKLVPQNSSEEPAEESLSRLGLKSTVVAPGDDAEDTSLPLSWARVRFEDVALVAGGVTLGRKLGDRKTVTLPYLRVANVKRGELDLTVIKEVSIAEDEIERYALCENDLLMTEGGDWDKVGRAAIWRAEIPACLHQNHVFRARMRSSDLTPFWFERYFNSPVGRGYFESASKQTTNLASINMRQVRSCPIPLPPLAEQRRIVAKVDQLMALVDELEKQLAASRATGETLLAALVAELTAGKLSHAAA